MRKKEEGAGNSPKNPCEIVGKWHIVLTGENGDVKQELRGTNVITDDGKDFLASYLHSATTSGTWNMKYVAIGTDSTGETASDTALGTESARHTGTVSHAGAIFSVVATFAAGTGTGAIVEYGLFSSNAGGTMFSRDTEAVINKGASDTLTVTTEVTFT